MEAQFGGTPHHYYGSVVSDLKSVGKRTLEWDLNDWKWDGDLFTATPLNSLPSDCRSRQPFPIAAHTGVSNTSSSCSDEFSLQKRELEKRRRVDEEEVCDEEEDGALNLKLGRQVYPITHDGPGGHGKKSKVAVAGAGGTSSRAVCQVDDCHADLSSAKDYHRRHKVCNLHSKATKAPVGNVMQRFCQQCSRFHALQEFDEGKRSCRRRLAGHNRRRRKTHPENTVSGTPLNDERSSSYLLISLLRILSNIHSNSSDRGNDQDLLSHLLKSLANLADDRNPSGSHRLPDAGTSFATPEKASVQPADQPAHGGDPRAAAAAPSPTAFNVPAKAAAGKTKLTNIDLNSAYDDSQDCVETVESFDVVPENAGRLPVWLRRDPNKSSPPQTSGNSGSTATQSPSSTSGEAQSRTDRIVFKLFGKDPNELPAVLRNQILDWLSHSPTDIEGYIRPGCIILSVYLRMENSSWEELCYDLSGHLRKLLAASDGTFWRSGWVYARVLDHVAFVCDGHVVLHKALPPPPPPCNGPSVLNVTPIAVPVSETARFSVRGLGVSRSNSRLVCAFEGSYLVQTSCSDGTDYGHGLLSFSCSIPDNFGRGFIEIEDDSLGGSFFPFIVAERDVCSEIRTLESNVDVTETSERFEPRSRALDFVNELGWLLHRSRLKLRLATMDPSPDLFSFERFRWLAEFSVDRDWRAVVKTLLGLVVDGTVDTSGYGSVERALDEVGLLHRAVRRDSRPMVEFLLSYGSGEGSDPSGPGPGPALFRPDAAGPGGLTPLHVAAGKDGSEPMLDALTDDPQMAGLEAWRKARDSSGLTPYDYASMRGHYAYIHLVQRKINRNRSENRHVVLDIPAPPPKAPGPPPPPKAPGDAFETELAAVAFRRSCGRCDRKLASSGGGRGRPSLAIYKPAMLSMVAIAAVCVCVALLFKSSPQVMYVFQPFIWERLKYGAS